MPSDPKSPFQFTRKMQTTDAKPGSGIVAADDPVFLLAQIRDAIQELVPSGQAEDYVSYEDVPLDTSAGSRIVRPDGQYGWLYFPNAPRTLTIWSGSGRARLLGTVASGTSSWLQVPKGQELLIEWGTGTAATLSYWVSSRPITYQAANSNFLSTGALSPVAAEDSAHASGDFGIAAWGVVNENETLLTDTVGDYSPLAVTRMGYLNVSMLRNSGLISSDGLSNNPAYMITNARNNSFPIMLPMTYNGATYDRQRGNVEGTALASAARTATTQSADIVNYNGRGVHVWLNITAVPGVDTLSVSVLFKDPVSGTYKTGLLSGTTAIAGAYHYQVYPGATDTGAVVEAEQGLALPRTFAIRVNHSGAGSFTYSVGYSIIL